MELRLLIWLVLGKEVLGPQGGGGGEGHPARPRRICAVLEDEQQSGPR